MAAQLIPRSASIQEPLSELDRKLLARQAKLIKALKLRQSYQPPEPPLSREEVQQIGRRIGIWTATGKLTASYKK
ncbi:hypothetical protein [Janthinobacterium sp. HH01]|uniref:hypothetical protein n=1 Tax=Janthinobacterium sp. HH01 TaxID=1198452 RepID=UPI0012693C2C|nr:hypothetical protein [Janthinobacterium sp. HH01]